MLQSHVESKKQDNLYQSLTSSTLLSDIKINLTQQQIEKLSQTLITDFQKYIIKNHLDYYHKILSQLSLMTSLTQIILFHLHSL